MLIDGMPADREELQKLLNAAYRKGNQDAHAARDILVKLAVKLEPHMLPNGGTTKMDCAHGYVDYGFRRGWQALAARLGVAEAIEAEKAQKRRDEYAAWDEMNRLSGVGEW